MARVIVILEEKQGSELPEVSVFKSRAAAKRYIQAKYSEQTPNDWPERSVWKILKREEIFTGDDWKVAMIEALLKS